MVRGVGCESEEWAMLEVWDGEVGGGGACT